MSSISARALSRRRFSIAFAGVWPVSAWKARLNWRGERCATSAIVFAFLIVNFLLKAGVLTSPKTTQFLSARPRCNPPGVPYPKCLMVPMDFGCAMRRRRSGRIAKGARRNAGLGVRHRRPALQIAEFRPRVRLPSMAPSSRSSKESTVRMRSVNVCDWLISTATLPGGRRSRTHTVHGSANRNVVAPTDRRQM